MPHETNSVNPPTPQERVRSLIIVAREQQELWQALTREFKDIPEIQVLLDRRRGERRRVAQPVSQDRRGVQRRSVPRLEDDLHARQYVLVRPRHPKPSD